MDSSGDGVRAPYAAPPTPVASALVGDLHGLTDVVEVGRGGDSTIYRAHQRALGRDVAIKVVNLSDPDDIRRFEREIALTVSLGRQHPNIVNVLDTRTLADGRPAIVMDFHELGSTYDRLRAAGAFAVQDVVTIGMVIGDAVGFAHSHGVLHRDVKPQNILILPTSYVLADFGIARMVDTGHTSSLERLSYRHASPEVLDGQQPEAADDVWSLASSLFMLAEGRAPYSSDDPDDDTALAYLRRVRLGLRRPFPDDLPEPLRAVLDRGLHPRRDRRYVTAEQLVNDLRAIDRGFSAWAPGAVEEGHTRPMPADLPTTAAGGPAAPDADATAPPPAATEGIPAAPAVAPSVPAPPAVVPRAAAPGHISPDLVSRPTSGNGTAPRDTAPPAAPVTARRSVEVASSEAAGAAPGAADPSVDAGSTEAWAAARVTASSAVETASVEAQSAVQPTWMSADALGTAVPARPADAPDPGVALREADAQFAPAPDPPTARPLPPPPVIAADDLAWAPAGLSVPTVSSVDSSLGLARSISPAALPPRAVAPAADVSVAPARAEPDPDADITGYRPAHAAEPADADEDEQADEEPRRRVSGKIIAAAIAMLLASALGAYLILRPVSPAAPTDPANRTTAQAINTPPPTPSIPGGGLTTSDPDYAPEILTVAVNGDIVTVTFTPPAKEAQVLLVDVSADRTGATGAKQLGSAPTGLTTVSGQIPLDLTLLCVRLIGVGPSQETGVSAEQCIEIA